MMICSCSVYIPQLFPVFSGFTHLPVGKCPPQPRLKWWLTLSTPLFSFFPSQAVSLSPSASPLTLSPHSLSLSLHLNTLVPCSSPSPLLLHSSVTHLFRLSLGTISTIGDPHCICVLPGGRTPRSHHFHPREFHAGSAAPSQAEHRAEDPGGSCCGGHAGPGSGRPHPCVGQLCWHRWYR